MARGGLPAAAACLPDADERSKQRSDDENRTPHPATRERPARLRWREPPVRPRVDGAARCLGYTPVRPPTRKRSQTATQPGLAARSTTSSPSHRRPHPCWGSAAITGVLEPFVARIVSLIPPRPIAGECREAQNTKTSRESKPARCCNYTVAVSGVGGGGGGTHHRRDQRSRPRRATMRHPETGEAAAVAMSHGGFEKGCCSEQQLLDKNGQENCSKTFAHCNCNNGDVIIRDTSNWSELFLVGISDERW